MSNKQTLVVFGATGIQGGSVAKSILNDPMVAPQFHVKAVTRNPSKPAALALAELGAELIKADLNDKDSLRVALVGADAVFLVTNFGEIMDHEQETQQGVNVADVSKETGVKHLIWSSLPYVSKVTNGKYTAVVHFDSKAKVDEHIRAIGVPHTIVNVGTYTNFLVEALTPIPSVDSPPSYGLFFPGPVTLNTEFPLINASTDVGKFVKGILLNREKTLGRQLNLAERYYTTQEFLDIAKKLGVNVTFQAIDKETFKAGMAKQGAPEFFQEDVVQVIQYAAEFGFWGGKAFKEEHSLLSERLLTLKEALKSSDAFAKLKGA
ncbi:NmrA/HSCARG family protein [Aspergillus stella-maris]|uniref:NmrA/HSCARG family protein n=1 Tax=Aspergillus stella-maris TaxID=1810926 RepID=UPI003CCE1718